MACPSPPSGRREGSSLWVARPPVEVLGASRSGDPGAGMAEREIVGIVWHQLGDVVDLIYVDGGPDRLVGALPVVTELADSVGLVIVPTPSGTVRWIRRGEEASSEPA
jgi:hypothetical protein